MLVNNIDLNELLQDTFNDHQSDFNWRRGTKVFNKTSFFALPMIGMSLEGTVCARYLRNAYIDDKSCEHDLTNPLFMLFKVANTKDKAWQDFIKAVTSRESYITDYVVGKEGNADLFMYVFQIPKQFEQDFEYFKKGRYSLMSDAYKAKYTQWLYSPTGTKRESRMYGILHKSSAIKDEVVKMFIVPTTSTPDDVIALRREMDTWDEVWDAPNLKAEVFHYEPDASEHPFWESATLLQERNGSTAQER